MSAWNIVLFILSFFPLFVALYYFSNFIAQGRRNWRRINVWVILSTITVFAYSCWQISFFYDESYYLILPFPQDYFSHIYLFLTPTFLALLAIPKMYTNISKILYACLFLSVMLATLLLFAYPGKDLIWFTLSLSTLLVFIGLKEEQYNIYYKHFIKYLFLENTWAAFFYFKNENLFALGIILQTVSRYYYFQFLNLFWMQGFLHKNYEKNQTISEMEAVISHPSSGLIKK